MAGMTAALYAKRANLDFKIVGRDEYDFGQIGNAILVENFPCVESQSGFDLAMKLHDQLTVNEIEIEEHEIIEVTKNNKIFTIKYADGASDTAKTVIYALGARHRKLDCEIGDGIPIHYCALCDGALYKDKTVAVIGGGDVAFTQAEYLSKICKQVTIVMCDENITAAPRTYERVKKIKNIQIIYNFPVSEVYKNCNGNIYITTTHKIVEPFGEPIITKKSMGLFDGIFVAIGMIPNTSIIKFSERILNSDGTISTDNSCHSYMPGFIAAGDVRSKFVRQGLTAAADGAIAVDSAIRHIKNYFDCKEVDNFD